MAMPPFSLRSEHVNTVPVFINMMCFNLRLIKVTYQHPVVYLSHSFHCYWVISPGVQASVKNGLQIYISKLGKLISGGK